MPNQKKNRLTDKQRRNLQRNRQADRQVDRHTTRQINKQIRNLQTNNFFQSFSPIKLKLKSLM